MFKFKSIFFSFFADKNTILDIYLSSSNSNLNSFSAINFNLSNFFETRVLQSEEFRAAWRPGWQWSKGRIKRRKEWERERQVKTKWRKYQGVRGRRAACPRWRRVKKRETEKPKDKNEIETLGPKSLRIAVLSLTWLRVQWRRCKSECTIRGWCLGSHTFERERSWDGKRRN